MNEVNEKRQKTRETGEIHKGQINKGKRTMNIKEEILLRAEIRREFKDHSVKGGC